MVTSEKLREYTSRMPFSPFWLDLADGERLVVTERFRAVVMPRQMVVSPDGKTLRWISLNQISDHGSLSAGSDATGNGGAA
jgi:hypothetical protein